MNSNEMKRRDSYLERICDDLSEVILQYLSLEDKLRLECVSQQFRKTLFTKHYSIEIIPKMQKMSSESNEKLFKKFGSNIVSLKVFDLLQIPYLSQLSNIEELIVYRIPDLTDVHFNSLKRLEIRRLNNEDFKKFEVLIEDNRNTLKHLEIGFLHINKNRVNLFKTLFTLISKLRNLIVLKIESILLLDKRFETHLTQITLNCNQLKSLCFCYGFHEFHRIEDLLSFLKRFIALKRLDLFIGFLISDEKTIEIYLTTLFKCEVFRELTHLKYWIRSNYSIDGNNVFEDIEKNSPKLQSLIINGIKFNCNENTADILSRLSKLQTIVLFITKESAKYEIAAKLKEKLKRFTRIDIQI